MAKIKRKKVIVEGSYNFDTRYEEVMSYFDDKKVISICLVSSKENMSSLKEEYLVFYEDKSKDNL